VREAHRGDDKAAERENLQVLSYAINNEIDENKRLELAIKVTLGYSLYFLVDFVITGG